MLLSRWKEATGEAELPPDQDNVVKEHLSVKAFMVGGAGSAGLCALSAAAAAMM